MLTLCVTLLLATSSLSFRPLPPITAPVALTKTPSKCPPGVEFQPSMKVLQMLPVVALLPAPALADSPDWGLFEGKTGSLLHPAMMGSLFLLSLSTGWKGWQWRRQRELGGEIQELKKVSATTSHK